MGQDIAVRTDCTAAEVRGLAKHAKDATQARRLPAIAAVLDGSWRTEAARNAGPDRRTARGKFANACIGHCVRSVVPRRDAGRPEEQADLSLGHEGFTSASGHDQRTQSTYVFGAVCPARGAGAALVLPSCNTQAMQLH